MKALLTKTPDTIDSKIDTVIDDAILEFRRLERDFMVFIYNGTVGCDASIEVILKLVKIYQTLSPLKVRVDARWPQYFHENINLLYLNESFNKLQAAERDFLDRVGWIASDIKKRDTNE